MKTKYFFVSLFLVSLLSFAQNQKFTMAEAVNGLRSNLAVENISQFKFIPDENYFIQKKHEAYLATNLKTQVTDTLISLDQINKNLDIQDKFQNLPPLEFENQNKAVFKQDNQFYTLQRSGGVWNLTKETELEKEAANIAYLPNKKSYVYTVKNNLYILKKGKVTAITNDQDENIINGQAVHRNEFGITDGIFPSPDQENFAFYRMDQRMVRDYPVIDWSVTPAQNHNIKYPMAGRKSHEVSLGVYNINRGTTTFLNIEGDKEQYLTAISWSPDSKYIFVGVLNRDQNHLMMNQYNAQTGDFIRTLFEEQNDQYVEPEKAMVFFPNSDTNYIWQSKRSGYNHLYHYNLEKGFIAQLTKGDWLITELLGFNEKKKDVYFIATKESPLERHLYRVNWINFKVERMDKEPGIHSGILSSDGNWLYDVYSNAETPRVAKILNTSTRKSVTLLKAPNPLRKYDRPEVQNVNIRANDGTPLYGKLILPVNFDTNKKYPVIVYLYNGPHVQLVTNSFPASGNLWYEYLAQRGYIVFTMDGRGSSNRGTQFEQAVFRHLGEVEMKDQLKGVEYLKNLPYVDAKRMGVHGWSFGGFMTTSLMLKYPDVFKVGVAGGPVIDWNMYEIMYTERYMDTPQKNPEGYAQANLLDKVQNLKGHLLVIHGAQDDVVVWQHSIKLIKAMVDNGVQMDSFIYPGHKHNVLGQDRVHLMQKVTAYFDLYLK